MNHFSIREERRVSKVKELLKVGNWLSGLQWLFFIFTNIVIIPITVGAAFDLPQDVTANLLQLSFALTGIACVLQAVFGHKRAIMEGNSGLWWGVILTLSSMAVAQGMSFTVLGGSITVGVIISGVLTIIIGVTGAGYHIAKLFKPGVMGVFMFLFGAKLIGIFLKGMLGIPFGQESESASIDLSVSLLSVIIAIIVTVVSVKAPPAIRRYALLIGIIIGWVAFNFSFGQQDTAAQTSSSLDIELFPLGKPAFNIGIIITTVIAGLLNTANTFGALKSTRSMYGGEPTKGQYNRSFTITGIFTGFAGFLGLVPYAPYVSSRGFLSQTGIIRRLPFILGGFMFFIMGIIPPIGHFFSLMPLSVGSAVLFVSYMQLFHSSWVFFEKITFNTLNIYRAAIPIFVGMIIMTMPLSYFESLPSAIRPLISSGMLVGIVLALILENVFKWDRIGKNN